MKIANLLPCFKKMYCVQFNTIKTFALISTTEMKHLLGQGECDYPKLLSQCCGLVRNLIPIFIRLLIKIFTKTRSTIIRKAFLDSDWRLQYQGRKYDIFLLHICSFIPFLWWLPALPSEQDHSWLTFCSIYSWPLLTCQTARSCVGDRKMSPYSFGFLVVTYTKLEEKKKLNTQSFLYTLNLQQQLQHAMDT
jgi:hypothetical protein